MNRKFGAIVSAVLASAFTVAFSVHTESAESDKIDNGYDCPISPRIDWRPPGPLTEKWFKSLVTRIYDAEHELHLEPITKNVSCIFYILKNGNMNCIYVSSKSGDAEIDKQVVQILEKAQPIVDPPPQLLTTTLKVKFTSDSRVEVFYNAGRKFYESN